MKPPEKKKILIIEDEMHIAGGLKLNLELQEYDIEIAGDGSSGLQKWKQWKPDLIVLDIMLPVIDGFSVLRSIRLEDERIPILILSARGDVDDKVKGLSYGSDDYLSKPFNLDEFLLRVDRLLTRVSWNVEPNGQNERPAHSSYSFGGNRIDFETSTAHCMQGENRLTTQKSKILYLSIYNRGLHLSRCRLLEFGL